MDITLDLAKAVQAQQERNSAYTQAELKAACAEGAQALVDAKARGETILLMDEASANVLYNAYAVGWNSEWAKAHTQG